MRLFIAEKPSLARAIADALPGPKERSNACIACGADDVVAWCAGHILETAPPEAYSPAFKHWRLEHLPIVPKVWKLEVRSAGLLRAIKSFLKKADRVVHAGDPDREGQLLVDEVLDYLGYRGPVERLLVNDLTPEAVRRALARLEPNRKYRALFESALARQRADWLYGMNMTRLYTLLGRNGGYDGVLSVGRVQTPLLGLIVSRDLAIENFRPVSFYNLFATFEAADGTKVGARWRPGDAALAHLDEEGRLLQRDAAESVRARALGHEGVVVNRTEEKKVEGPPLPFSLASLQVQAGKELGLSAARTLAISQSLYETHRLITYPRSDCSHLPEAQLDQAKAILDAARQSLPELAPMIEKADLSLRSKAWNNRKITAHHAIVPTASTGRTELNEDERALFELICRRYILQFYNMREVIETRLDIEVAGELFSATGQVVIAEGWKALAGHNRHPDEEHRGDVAEDEPCETLPPPIEGSRLLTAKVDVLEKATTPPRPFSDASVIEAMCNIAKYVADPAVQKILRDTDGIGTPATRAAILETLLARGYIVRKRKTIVSTPTGRALIRALPNVATTPNMTAIWEAAMRAISDGEKSLDAFLRPVTKELNDLVRLGVALGSLQVGESFSCERGTCTGHLRRIRGKNGYFWSCVLCRMTVNDTGGRPLAPPTTAPDQRRIEGKKHHE